MLVQHSEKFHLVPVHIHFPCDRFVFNFFHFVKPFCSPNWLRNALRRRGKKDRQAGCIRHASCAFFGRMRLISWRHVLLWCVWYGLRSS